MSLSTDLLKDDYSPYKIEKYKCKGYLVYKKDSPIESLLVYNSFDRARDCIFEGQFSVKQREALAKELRGVDNKIKVGTIFDVEGVVFKVILLK
jgi:hypothetical protein